MLKMKDLKVGDHIIDFDGIYEVTEIFHDCIYYNEITFDENDEMIVVRENIPMTRFDVEKCERF